ncbi:MAG: hypothetical protein H6727_04030 [Myxococcales bacterium]|nr:hypothetical protein [Myxococcales bacterium]
MRKRTLFLLLGLVLPLTLWIRGSSQAQVCEPEDTQKALQYLRRLSLDLRNYPPSQEEAMEVIKAKQVPEALIDKMVQSPEALQRLRNYHRDLLWGNINDLSFIDQDFRLGGDGDKVPLFNRYRSTRYRKHTEEIGCLDEPARIENGAIQTTCQNGSTLCQEGYVMVSPYWAPDTKIKVCAFDAQETMNAKNAQREDVPCSTRSGVESAFCGCGPNLMWCQSENHRTERTIQEAMVEQMLYLAQSLAKDGKPYTQVLTSNFVVMNGPLAHFWKHQAQTVSEIRLDIDQRNTYPDLKFHEKDKWVQVERPAIYSGILTMPAFLLKFATNRSRANRFYQAFLCTEFQAPPDGLPPGQDSCHEEPNLMKRCGCKYCHQALEPAASHWGRFFQGGLATLDPEKYPSFLEKCAKAGTNDRFCRDYYFTRPNHPDEEEYRGYLNSYIFADKRMKENIEKGPRNIADQAIQGGAFASCVSRKMWGWFAGDPTPTEERIKVLSDRFSNSQFKLLDLIKAVVTSPEYKQGAFYKP